VTKPGTFCIAHGLNVSHVIGNPNLLLGNKNSAWTTEKARFILKVFLDAYGLVHYKFIPEGRIGRIEKETSGKMGTKQLVSSARQRICIKVAGGQKASCQA
jgi:hypothetical protein